MFRSRLNALLWSSLQYLSSCGGVKPRSRTRLCGSDCECVLWYATCECFNLRGISACAVRGELSAWFGFQCWINPVFPNSMRAIRISRRVLRFILTELGDMIWHRYREKLGRDTLFWESDIGSCNKRNWIWKKDWKCFHIKIFLLSGLILLYFILYNIYYIYHVHDVWV